MTDLRTSTIGNEVWTTNIAPIQITTAGYEAWSANVAPIAITNTGYEMWFAGIAPDFTPALKRRFMVIT